MKTVQKTGFMWLLLFLSMICMVFGHANLVHAASVETKDNPAVSISVTYSGGTMIVGKSVSKSELTVTATLTDGSSTSVSNYSIKNKKVTSESHVLEVTYKNKVGETLTASTTITAITDFTKIRAVLNDGNTFDYGDAFSKSMFTVTAVLSDGREKVLSDDAFSLSSSRYDAEGKTSMKLSITATNSDGKEKKSIVTIKALKAVKSISITGYSGGDKDINDTLSTSEFTVSGLTYGGSTVNITDFTLSSERVSKSSNNIAAYYTNSLGKKLKSSSYKVIATKCIKSLTRAEYVGGAKLLGDSISASDFNLYGVTYGGTSVSITGFTLDKATIGKLSESVKLTYQTTLGKNLSKTVKVTSTNPPESLSVELAKEKKIGDSLKSSDFTVIATFHDGTKKKITSSTAIKLDTTVVPALENTVTVTYSDSKSGESVSGTCTFTAADIVNDNDGVTITYTRSDTYYKVGDTVTANDFSGTAITASGATEEITSLSIKSGSKLKNVTNTVTVSYKVGSVSGTKQVIVKAKDYITKISAEMKNASAHGVGATIDLEGLNKMIKVSEIWASGNVYENDTVTDLSEDDRIQTIKVKSTGANLTKGGSLTLTGNDVIIIEFKDPDNDFPVTAVEMTVKPSFTRADPVVKQKKSSTYLEAGTEYELSDLISVKGSGKEDLLMLPEGTQYPAYDVTISSDMGKYIIYTIDSATNTIKVPAKVKVSATCGKTFTLKITTTATNAYNKSSTTFKWNVRTLKDSSAASYKVGFTYTAADFVTSNDTSTAISMAVTGGTKKIATVTGNKLKFSAAGTVEVTFTQGGTSKTVSITVKE